MRPLSFYDHHRMDWAQPDPEAYWRERRYHGGHVGEISVGDYSYSKSDVGIIGPRGEMVLDLYQLALVKPIRVRACVFLTETGGVGVLRALERARILDKIRKAQLRDRDDLTRLLVNCGLRDLSHRPLEGS